MTEYTRENPFEFEGVKVWRHSSNGAIVTKRPENALSNATFTFGADAAIHAFIEAEREGWRWTNEAHTEARKGRFTVTWDPSFKVWGLRHDDFPGAVTTENNRNTGMWVWITEEKIKDFRAWLADQPAEPTEEQVEARVRAEWADYFESMDQQVGAALLSGHEVATALRGPRPFGLSAAREAGGA